MRRFIACMVLAAMLLAGCSTNAQTDLSGRLAGGLLDAVQRTPEPAAENTPQPMKISVEETPAQGAGTAAYDGPLFLLRTVDFVAMPVEFGTEFSRGGTHVDCYSFDSFVSVSFGRLSPSKNSSEAIYEIGKIVPINEDSLEITDGLSFYGYPAAALSYTTGGNEDLQICRDMAVLGDDALHWFHCAVYADWFNDYEEVIENWIDKAYLVQVTEEQLTALRPGQASAEFADIQYFDDATMLVKDYMWIDNSDEALLDEYGIEPDPVQRYSLVVKGDGSYYPRPMNEYAYYDYLYYTDTTESGFDYIIVMCMDEFSDELEARCAQWDGAAMFVQLTYAGDTVIGVHEVFIS